MKLKRVIPQKMDDNAFVDKEGLILKGCVNFPVKQRGSNDVC